MNKSIYIFINNEDYPEVCYSSYDEFLLREIMCDEFMFDVMREFNLRMNRVEIVNNEFLKDNNKRIAQESWNDILDYYNAYVDICRSEVI